MGSTLPLRMSDCHVPIETRGGVGLPSKRMTAFQDQPLRCRSIENLRGQKIEHVKYVPRPNTPENDRIVVSGAPRLALLAAW